MTPIDPAQSEESTTASRNLQRQSLEQIVSLSIECADQEQRIEQQHADALAREESQYRKKLIEAQERYQQLQTDSTQNAAQQRQSIQSRHDSELLELESEHTKQEHLIAQKKADAESSLKKQVEHASWEAEKNLTTLKMQIDAEVQQAKHDHDVSKAELAILTSIDAETQEALARCGLQPYAVNVMLAPELKERLANVRLAVLAEERQQAKKLLLELQALTKTSIVEDILPLFLIALFVVASGAIGWLLPQDSQTKLLSAGGAVLGAIILSITAFVILKINKRKRVHIKARALYEPLKQALTIAVHAARFDDQAAAAERERRVREARAKRDHDLIAAKEKGKALLAELAQKYQDALTQEELHYKNQLAFIEEQTQDDLEALQQKQQEDARQYEQENARIQQETQEQHALALRKIESEYETQFAALTARWDDGLRAVTELLSAGSGIDPQLVDWNSPAWDQWKSPGQFTGQVRFGDMKVDLAQLTDHVPKRLKLPESFRVPAMLSMPANASLLLDADRSGRAACNDLAQLVMARLLTQLPAGRVKFTIFDPVGLGQGFAGFMHLADHDESLVGSRIWTESEHMQQRLADLTEHMETVIQKYLRNEYATIDQYNAQAGELAEPFRFLVVADFPTGFEQESLRRLSSIAISGARCGVYTIILRDTTQPIPSGSRMEDIIARSVHLQYQNGAFVWDDAVFKRFPLRIDAQPEEQTLTRLMNLVGNAAREAKRVEVPYQSIAPKADQFWSLNSKSDLRVPIGKSGATRLQSFRLGIGVAQHALVAGKTGSGKSNLMHTIITNLSMWYGPDEVEFYLIDFKKGVEFKAYATSLLPHARAIAVESDREFGLSVLHRVDAELARRGNMFRDVGAQDIGTYRDKTGQKLPRTVLLIDEFQEFFSEDDKIGQDASGLLDRIVRQGRAFGVHLILGSQTIGGNSGLARSTLGQIAVRVALQCSEADSQMILGDNNSAARLLTRPGEAIYNDAGGLVEANSPFQIAFLPDAQREKYLDQIRAFSLTKSVTVPTPIVFEGNSAAAIRKNARLMELLNEPAPPPAASSVPAYVGEPVAIKDPSAISFRRQSGSNVLMVGQQEESAVAIFASMLASLSAGQKSADAIFYLLDGSPADSRYFGLLQRVTAALPNETKVVSLKQVPDAINELATILADRQQADAHAGPNIFLLLFGLQRYRLLRRQKEEFSFSSSEETAAPKTDEQFAQLLEEGPEHGMHTVIWSDSPITLERTLDRSSMRQFDHRILFQMSASDSSNLIDSPLANRLGAHRALLYSEEQGTFEKFRPYEVPDDAWIQFLADHLKNVRG